MGNEQERLDRPVEKVTGPTVGDNLLQSLKKSMRKQEVFRLMFGKDCERVFINELPSYNDTIMPLFELYWGQERFDNGDVYQTGSLDARMILPAKLSGDYNKLRLIAKVFQRWLGSEQNTVIQDNAGLLEFGAGSNFSYNNLLKANGMEYPFIAITMPYKFDLHLWQRLNPDVNFDADLDACLIPDGGSYIFEFLNDEGPEPEILLTVKAQAGQTS